MNFVIRRIDVKDVWPIRHRVMWPEQPLTFVQLKEDDIGEHFGLFDEDQLKTVASIFSKGSEFQFRKLATEISAQGNGYGSAMIEFLIEEVKRQGATKIWCNARVDKTGLYRRFGLFETKDTFVKGGIDFVIMERCF